MGGKLRDEILELIWALREKGSKSMEDVIKGLGDNDTSDEIRKMEKAGSLLIKDNDLELTEKGEVRARDLTRRHRLAERLFHDVLLSRGEKISLLCKPHRWSRNKMAVTTTPKPY